MLFCGFSRVKCMKKFISCASSVPELRTHWGLTLRHKLDRFGNLDSRPLLLGATPNSFSIYFRNEQEGPFKLFQEYDWAKMNKISVNGPEVSIQTAELPKKIRQRMKFVFSSPAAANAFFGKCREVSDHQKRAETFSKCFGSQQNQSYLSDTRSSLLKERLVDNLSLRVDGIGDEESHQKGVEGLNRWKKFNIQKMMASSEDIIHLVDDF